MRRKKKAFGHNPFRTDPLEAVIPTDPGKSRKPGKSGKLTAEIDPDLLERLRDVAWQDRLTLGAIIEDALRPYLARKEKRRGRSYPKRPARALRDRGRPIGS